MPDNVRLKAQCHTTAKFLAAIDTVRVDPGIVTAASAVLDGKVTLFLGNAYTQIPVYADDDPRQHDADRKRNLILRHEAAHVAMGHQARQGERDHETFNQVCDCAIHVWWTAAELEELDSLIDGVCCSYDRMHLDVLPPELAYDQLIERDGVGGNGDGPERGPVGPVRPRDGTAADDGEPGPPQPGEEPGETASEDGDTQAEPIEPEDLATCKRPTDEELQEAYAETKPGEDLIQDAENNAIHAELVQEIIEAMQQDKRDGEGWVPDGVMEYEQSESAGRDGTGVGRSETATQEARPAWVDELIARLEVSGAKTERGSSYRREHRELDMLPGRTRTRGVNAVIMIDASGSINTKALSEMLAGLLDGGWGESTVYVHDTQVYGPWPAWDIKSIEHGVRRAGGGTRIYASWKAVENDVDPNAVRVFFSDAQDWDGMLPEPRHSDIWAYVGYPGITIHNPHTLYKKLHREEPTYA